MEKEIQVLKLQKMCEKSGVSSDLIDISSECDSSLKLSENETHLKEIMSEMGVKEAETLMSIKLKDIKAEAEQKEFKTELAKNESNMKIRRLFGGCSIIGLAGGKNTGKTNNLIALMIDFRKYNKTTPFYIYGFKRELIEWLKKNVGNVTEISSLKQLSSKRDGIAIIDEFQKLNLSDRRYKNRLNSFVDFVYHKNNKVIFCSPNLREFNSIIGGKIERWVLKSLKVSDLINGSQLKDAVLEYQGYGKSIEDIETAKNELLILNDSEEEYMFLDYIQEVDEKRFNKDIFSENCQENVKLEMTEIKHD